MRIEELIQLPVVYIHDEYVPVTCRCGAAFNWRVRWYRIGTRIALVRVLERNGNSRVITAHCDVRNSDGTAEPGRSEIRMERCTASAGRDERRTAGIDRIRSEERRVGKECRSRWWED